jgi:hypothetical protein
MNKSELLLNQKMLLARSARLREDFGVQAAGFKKPLLLADRLQAGLKWLYSNPAWPLGALLTVLVLRPRRSLVWGLRLWSAWKTFKRTKKWLLSLPLNRIPF